MTYLLCNILIKTEELYVQTNHEAAANALGQKNQRKLVEKKKPIVPKVALYSEP